jgi:hypothetical protein
MERIAAAAAAQKERKKGSAWCTQPKFTDSRIPFIQTLKP